MENNNKTMNNAGLVTRDSMLPDWYELEFNEHAVDKVLRDRMCSGYVVTPEKFVEGDYYIKVHMAGKYRMQICPHVVACDLAMIYNAYTVSKPKEITNLVRYEMTRKSIPTPSFTLAERNYYRYLKMMRLLITTDVETGVYSSKHSITHLMMFLLIDSVMLYIEMIGRNNPIMTEDLTKKINENKDLIVRLAEASDYDENYIGADPNIKNLYVLLTRLNAKIPDIKVLDETTDIVAKCIHSVHKTKEEK